MAAQTSAKDNTGCDMSEEELLAMLKGISADKIIKEEEEHLQEKHQQEAAHEAPPEAATAPAATGEPLADFLAGNPENPDMNQYWYSPPTIRRMVQEVRAHGCPPDCDALRVGFISTPSLFFTLAPDERGDSVVLDFDRKWEGERGYHFYDFNEPEAVPDHLRGTLALVVVDPPFIVREAWEKYAITIKALLAPEGKILLSTIAENAPMMAELLAVKPQRFRPSIPNLVYQYALYTNYESSGLAELNPEIDP